MTLYLYFIRGLTFRPENSSISGQLRVRRHWLLLPSQRNDFLIKWHHFFLTLQVNVLWDKAKLSSGKILTVNRNFVWYTSVYFFFISFNSVFIITLFVTFCCGHSTCTALLSQTFVRNALSFRKFLLAQSKFFENLNKFSYGNLIMTRNKFHFLDKFLRKMLWFFVW